MISSGGVGQGLNIRNKNHSLDKVVKSNGNLYDEKVKLNWQNAKASLLR